MTTDKVIAAAREDAEKHADAATQSWGEPHPNWADEYDRKLYAIAYRAGMERAAEIAEARKHITPEWQLDQHYNQACTHCAAAIRAHAKNQPESTHDTGNV